MNILEAIKSGKRFWRVGWESDRYCRSMKDVFGVQPLELDYESVLADDWEVESQPVMITREQFNAAWEKIVYCHDHEREEMIEELGL